jgi:predicted metalloprotease with PDZ domain
MIANLRISLLALLVATATPLIAGEKYKCTATTQECLDSLVEYYRNTGWFGVNWEFDESTQSYEVVTVHPDSPAEEAGLMAGDRVVAINGMKFSDKDEKLKQAMKEKKKPGAKFLFTVIRSGKKKDIPLIVGVWPEDYIATMVGQHMLQHVSEKPAKNAKKDGGR